MAIKDDPTHFLDESNPQNALLLKKLKDGKTGMIGVRREDTPENLIVHALKSSNKKEIERLVRRQMGRASLPTTLKNETGTGAKAHSSASGGIISQNSAKGEAAEQGSKLERAEAKQEVVEGEGWTMRDGGAAKTGRAIKDVAKKQENNTIKKGEAPGQHPGANFANEKIINQPGLRLNKSREKLIKNTDVSKLNDEQKSVYDVFIGERDKVILQGKDLSDLYALEQGGKNAGAKKIMIKHAGIEKTGGLSNDELLNIMDVVRNGKIADDSFELRDDIIRYAYDLKKEDINFRVVIDEFNDGKKIFDYYSDRNFIDYGTTQKRLTGDKKFQSAPMAKDSQGLAFSPYKDDAQRVAQTNNDIILQNSAKGETAEQGSKLEQAEAKQEVVKGEGWTMRDGKLTYLDQVKFELNDWLKAQTGIDDVITASLAWLKSEHPEMHNSKRAVKELIEYVLDRPSVVKSGKSENSVYLGKADDSKMKDIVIDKGDKKIIHANRRRMNAEERGQWQGRPPSLHTDTKPAGANGANARSLTTDSIISQNSAKDETAIKTYVNPHVGAGLAGGTLNAKDENGNFDAEKFAKGFIYGLFGSKVTAATLKKTNPKLYDQIVNIGKDKAGKEKISSFVNKLKQDELGKLLQKTITNKDLSTKTKVEIIEAAKKRFAKETPKSLNGQSEAQMSESALKAKENNLKIDDVSNDAKEKWIKTFGLKSIDDDFIPNLKPEVKKAIKDKEIRLTKGSLLKDSSAR